MLFCHVTSRVEGAAHPKLLTEKGGTGFPTLVFMDARGKVLAKHMGPRTVEGFRKTRDAVVSLITLKEKAAAGDPDAQRGLFLAELDLGRLDFAQAQARYEKLRGFSEEERARVYKALINLEFDDVFNRSRKEKVPRKVLAQRLLAMKKKGRIPSGTTALRFWDILLGHAMETKDARLFEEGVRGFKKQIGSDPRYKRLLEKLDADLEKLKRSKR